jgi:galactose-1-phosphate uridylyltransferase
MRDEMRSINALLMSNKNLKNLRASQDMHNLWVEEIKESDLPDRWKDELRRRVFEGAYVASLYAVD